MYLQCNFDIILLILMQYFNFLPTQIKQILSKVFKNLRFQNVKFKLILINI